MYSDKIYHVLNVKTKYSYREKHHYASHPLIKRCLYGSLQIVYKFPEELKKLKAIFCAKP